MSTDVGSWVCDACMAEKWDTGQTELAYVTDAGASVVEVSQTATDAEQPDTLSDVTAADIADPCTVTIIPPNGPPPESALLPKESPACAALGVAACWNWSFYAQELGVPDFGLGLRCYDANGKVLFDKPPSQIPCSKAQLASWVQAYYACWKPAPASAMPNSAVTQILKPDEIPAKVCANAFGTAWHWVAGCAKHTYVAEQPLYDSGNDHWAQWRLTIQPATTATVNAEAFPFLACKKMGAIDYQLQIQVDVVPDAWTFAARKDFNNDSAGPPWSAPWWQPVLQNLAKNFVNCDKDPSEYYNKLW